ncbi:MAG TPA: nitrilase-related carbon-nitrogen hydrolase [Patescibacteria group bacterium]|nr:nitrilase-related carbon-nitrogen hydrolase [Patescibacteria group bacterium]
MSQSEKLTVSCFQFAPRLKDKEVNIEYIFKKIDSSVSDILVFPELATSGYFFTSRDEVRDVAEAQGGEFLKSIQQKAADQKKIIVCGFAESMGDKLFNSCVIALPDVLKTRVYRKTHLFYKEKYCFDAGDTGFFVVEDDSHGVRIGPMICYDWRFPEASRTLGLLKADIIVCPSNLVTDVWHIAMPARALENKVYLAVANRIGTEKRDDEELLFKGKSAIYAYNGSAMAMAGAESEEEITAEIEPLRTRDKSFNAENDIFKDRVPEFYL